jgi:hypothetical protein
MAVISQTKLPRGVVTMAIPLDARSCDANGARASSRPVKFADSIVESAGLVR